MLLVVLLLLMLFVFVCLLACLPACLFVCLLVAAVSFSLSRFCLLTSFPFLFLNPPQCEMPLRDLQCYINSQINLCRKTQSTHRGRSHVCTQIWQHRPTPGASLRPPALQAISSSIILPKLGKCGLQSLGHLSLGALNHDTISAT